MARYNQVNRTPGHIKMPSTASKKLLALASTVFVAIIINGLFGQNWLRDAYWVLPVAAFACAILVLLSVITSDWFGQKFERLAKRVPILATFFILVAGAAIIILSLTFGLQRGLVFSKRNLPNSEQTNSARDSKPEPILKVVPPSTKPDSPKPDYRHATAHRFAASAPPIHRTRTFVTFFVFNPNSRQLVCSVDLMKVALCTQLSQAISRKWHRRKDESRVGSKCRLRINLS